MSNNQPPEYRGNLLEKLPVEVGLDELQAGSAARWEQAGGTIPNVGDQSEHIGITGVPCEEPTSDQQTPTSTQPDAEQPGRQGHDR